MRWQRVARRPKRWLRWVRTGHAWIDHGFVIDSDLEWMADLRDLTVWNVTFPEGFLWLNYPDLVTLDVRGGSATTFELPRGCTGLQYLAVNRDPTGSLI